MLSYRHGFHAGNPADVVKHLVLVKCLEYLNRKDKPYCVIDTHAGAGRYSLTDKAARKTGEYEQGIGRLWQEKKTPVDLESYLKLVAALNRGKELRHYPGTPWLTQSLMREQDRALMYELHPSDHDQLDRLMTRDPRVQVRREDGFAGCIASLPPRERRGLIVMDPSYEVKTDYRQVVTTLEKAYRRFATGTFLVWYPVVDRDRVAAMERAIRRSGIRDVLQFELAASPDQPGHGMTASGVILVNPPWTLKDEMETVLPYLVEVLAPGEGSYRSKVITAE